MGPKHSQEEISRLAARERVALALSGVFASAMALEAGCTCIFGCFCKCNSLVGVKRTPPEDTGPGGCFGRHRRRSGTRSGGSAPAGCGDLDPQGVSSTAGRCRFPAGGAESRGAYVDYYQHIEICRLCLMGDTSLRN